MGDMPQITVEYSDSLTEAFDRQGFALAFHPVAAELIGSAVPGFKTRFYPITDAVIAAGDPGQAMVHVDLAILPGRDDDLKARLGELALDILSDHLKAPAELNVQVTVEIRDLTGYHKRVLTS